VVLWNKASISNVSEILNGEYDSMVVNNLKLPLKQRSRSFILVQINSSFILLPIGCRLLL